MRRAIYEDDVIKLLDKGWKTGVYPVASNIHALPPAQPNVPDTNVGDTISRQAAINIVVFECGEWTGLAKEISKQLRQLSSAQPDIIRCKDCKHWRSNTEFCSTFTELNVAHRMPPNGFCSCAERREE